MPVKIRLFRTDVRGGNVSHRARGSADGLRGSSGNVVATMLGSCEFRHVDASHINVVDLYPV